VPSSSKDGGHGAQARAFARPTEIAQAKSRAQKARLLRFRRITVIAVLVVLRGFAMMPGGLFVMLRRSLVMGAAFVHDDDAPIR